MQLDKGEGRRSIRNIRMVLNSILLKWTIVLWPELHMKEGSAHSVSRRRAEDANFE